MTEPFDVDALLASAAPRTREVRVCARGDLVDRHAHLVSQLAALEKAHTGSLAGNPEVQAVSAEIVAVEAEQEASTLTFHLTSIGRRKWAGILADHPPRKQDKGMGYNPETFPPAAVAACCTSPALSEDQAVRLTEKLPEGEWGKLWVTCLNLNLSETPHPKLGAATELARANGSS